MNTAARAEPVAHRDAAFGILRREGRVLLVCNDRVLAGEAQPCWDLPGGTVEAGEDLRAGLEREWLEEVGLPCTVGDLALLLDGQKRTADGDALIYTWRAFFFHVESEGEPKAGAGIEQVAWVPEDEVAARLEAPYHGPLRNWFGGDPRRHVALGWVEGDGRAVLEGEGVPRSLLVMAAAAAAGRIEWVGREVEAAMAAGEARARIEEALLYVAPYAGFPRTIAAFGVARDLLGDAPPLDEQPGDGAERFGAVYGETAPAVRRKLEALHPTLARWVEEFAYGRVYAREGALTLLEREWIAITILTALGGLERPLLGHMRAAMRLGSTLEQVSACVNCSPIRAGRVEARTLLQRVQS